MTRPRNERPGHPAWCRADKPDPFTNRHVSSEVRVGDRRNGGQAGAWLIQGDTGPTLVRLVAAQMTSATVEISVRDAARFRDGLTALLQAAGFEKPGHPKTNSPQVP